jgi:hypothetical protein
VNVVAELHRSTADREVSGFLLHDTAADHFIVMVSVTEGDKQIRSTVENCDIGLDRLKALFDEACRWAGAPSIPTVRLPLEGHPHSLSESQLLFLAADRLDELNAGERPDEGTVALSSELRHLAADRQALEAVVGFIGSAKHN